MSHGSAAGIGLVAGVGLGSGYGAAGLAMVAAILVMVVADVVHPPAVGTALGFAFHAGMRSNIGLFLIALGLVVLLAALQLVAQWFLSRLLPAPDERAGQGHPPRHPM